MIEAGPSMALRSISIAVACAFAIGCTAITSDQGPVASGSEDIVSVPQTDVERQSIGNTWIYAHVTWVEALHATATGEAFDVSASYWTYWHWFDQVAGGAATTLSTGGNWETANGIVRKYGLAHERAFVIADATMDMAARQTLALAALNASLQTGALSVPGARKDKALVRKELDRVFGADVSRTFSSIASPADPTGTDIQRATDFAVAYSTAPGTPNVQRHLDQAMREWRQVYYAPADRRATQIRVQQALGDAQPVIMTWFVDFNAHEDRDNGRLGSFNMTTLNELGSGVQGAT
jgi:hypothetical protein